MLCLAPAQLAAGILVSVVQYAMVASVLTVILALAVAYPLIGTAEHHRELLGAKELGKIACTTRYSVIHDDVLVHLAR